ncbi:hypothetical protein [Thalassospira tepidiphila]|uniref:hypothetical protein n=1 Tax=Thalassospira tepidiphila TaxID=393657 RepID=UPI003AA7F04F
MTNRTTSRILNFTRPFSMRGLAEVLPAGSYKVITEETQDENLTYPTWQWVSTQIHLNTNSDRPASSRVLNVEPRDLEVAYLRDQKTMDARPQVAFSARKSNNRAKRAS